MITKDEIKQILASNQKDVENFKIIPRTLPADEFPCYVFVGVRRAGRGTGYPSVIQYVAVTRHIQPRSNCIEKTPHCTFMPPQAGIDKR